MRQISGNKSDWIVVLLPQTNYGQETDDAFIRPNTEAAYRVTSL